MKLDENLAREKSVRITNHAIFSIATVEHDKIVISNRRISRAFISRRYLCDPCVYTHARVEKLNSAH